MNERIKLLAELAKFSIDVSNDPNSPPYWWAAGHNDCFEKFAQLIVRECISMADDFECDVNQRGLVDQMKQHFGVEE